MIMAESSAEATKMKWPICDCDVQVNDGVELHKARLNPKQKTFIRPLHS